jgi:hypothetical protein
MKMRPFLRRFIHCFLAFVFAPLTIYSLSLLMARLSEESLAPIIVITHITFFFYFAPVIMVLGRGSFEVGAVLSIDLGGFVSVVKTVIFYTILSAIVAFIISRWEQGKRQKAG